MSTPTDSTTAGSLCAIMVVVAPVTVVILNALIKSRPLALLASLLVSGGIIAGVVTYSLGKDPDEDTIVVVAAFGGWAAFLALGVSVLAFVARTLSARSKARAAPAS